MSRPDRWHFDDDMPDIEQELNEQRVRRMEEIKQIIGLQSLPFACDEVSERVISSLEELRASEEAVRRRATRKRLEAELTYLINASSRFWNVAFNLDPALRARVQSRTGSSVSAGNGVDVRECCSDVASLMHAARDILKSGDLFAGEKGISTRRRGEKTKKLHVDVFVIAMAEVYIELGGLPTLTKKYDSSNIEQGPFSNFLQQLWELTWSKNWYPALNAPSRSSTMLRRAHDIALPRWRLMRAN